MALFPKCSVSGCESYVEKSGMCGMHYSRMYRTGHLEQTRPSDWGSREKHPLYQTWCACKRYPTVVMCEEWRKDFWLFVADVGARPSSKHFLKCVDETQPLGKTNAAWKERLFEGLTQTTQEEKNTYLRAYRSVHKEKFQDKEIRRHYGITQDTYNKLREEHEDLCAICNEPETKKIRGNVVSLSVDHNHETGLVRGLLCMRCNRALGMFLDSRGLLQKAIDYLTKHHLEGEELEQAKQAAARERALFSQRVVSSNAQGQDSRQGQEVTDLLSFIS